MLQRGKLNIIIDGQWGSTGKGKVASYLAHHYSPAMAVCNFAPNAGHTHYDPDGNKFVLKQLPSSVLNDDVLLGIGPTAVLDVKRVLEEIETHGVQKRLIIDEKATILEDDDKRHEDEQGLDAISSTKQGGGYALARKVLRKARLARDVAELSPFIGDVCGEIHNVLRRGGAVLAESPQGFDLSLNHGHSYPFTTSRDITTSSIAADFGCPPCLVGSVFGVLRTYPIRVGNLSGEGLFNEPRYGWSGPCYPDQQEITWNLVANASARPKDIAPLVEKTTVTNKPRRVFTWSDAQFLRFLRYCAPTYLCINHVDYIDFTASGCNDVYNLPATVTTWLEQLVDRISTMLWQSASEPLSSVKIRLLGTGPTLKSMVNLEENDIWKTVRFPTEIFLPGKLL
jgi:adenylosuccinate synthase